MGSQQLSGVLGWGLGGGDGIDGVGGGGRGVGGGKGEREGGEEARRRFILWAFRVMRGRAVVVVPWSMGCQWSDRWVVERREVRCSSVAAAVAVVELSVNEGKCRCQPEADHGVNLVRMTLGGGGSTTTPGSEVV